MKLYHFFASLFLIISLLRAEDLIDKGITEDQSIFKRIDIDAIIKSKGWSVEGLEKIPTGRAIIFKKAEKILGYCIIEREKRAYDTTNTGISQTTKIVYGDPCVPPKGSLIFTIEDPIEIALWVAVCQNHTHKTLYKLRLFAMSGEAEFKNAVIEFDVGSRGGSDVGLHFYNGDEDTTIFSASTDELDRGEFNCNPILMSLVSAKIQKLKNQQRK